MADDVRFKSASGEEAQGAMSWPKEGKNVPGVVLIQEYWGINAHIRDLVDRLSREGFAVLAPDLYKGKIAKDAETAGKLMSEVKWPEVMQVISGAVKYLSVDARSNGKVGIIGFCMGGAAALTATVKVPGLSASVPFYGMPHEGVVDWKTVRVPIQGHFAKTDNWARPELVKAAADEVNANGGVFELHMYDAQHAFANDTRPEVHNPEATKIAWGRSVGFLHRHLG